ncbi:MAG: serine/threonine protein kinase [Blastocatellia bacterium]|nr:serine/threonine protein kinase [Blastocatellia bacterium]
MRECKQCRSCYDDSLEICPGDGEQLHYSLPISTIINDTYQLTNLLAHGSMGSVYRAEQQGLQRPVAIKILNPKLLTSNVARERFRREALAAASIKHPNIIAVYDFATTSNGLCYIVMELLEGQTLAQRLKVETKITVNEAVKITLEVCEALTQAHSRGMIHRDLKPSNIFLSQIGNDTVTKIIDFGLVKLKERTKKTLLQEL